MKKTTITTALWLLATLLYFSNAQTGWTQPVPFINEVRIDDVYFINADTGWLAGASVIRKTTDGGLSWTIQLNANQSYLRSIEFLDDKTGFCGSLDGNLFKTTDGGENWTDISLLIPGPTPGICGISHQGQNVYACGIWSYPAYFVKSTDVGETWTYTDMSEHAIALIDPVFFHPDSGFVAGQDELGGVILFTADGGETWEEVYNTQVSGEYVWKIQMLTRDTIFASVENFGSEGTILVSHDGGKNWMPKTFNFDVNIQAIGFVTGSKGWVGGYFDGIHETNDGGDTWQNIGVGNALNRIFVVNPQLAYASGESFYKYTGPEPPSANVPPLKKPDLDWEVRNPGSGNELSIVLRLNRTNNISIGLYDLNGRLIHHIYNGRLPMGEHVFNKTIYDVPNGSYLVGLQLNEGMSARRISIFEK